MSELKFAGLTEYESKIYLSLLESGPSTGGKIAKRSRVPHGKTYESLGSLADKGFVTSVPLKPKVF